MLVIAQPRQKLNLALGLSLGLHAALFLAVAALRSEQPLPAQSISVDWIEPVVGKDLLVSRAGAAKPAKNISPAAAALTSAQSAPSMAGEASPSISSSSQESTAIATQALAQKLSAEEAYISAVRHEIEARKVYPAMAKRLGQMGRVTLKFVVGKDGNVQSSELVLLSSFSALNQAAAALLASRFSPIPDELQRGSWEFTIPVEYRLE